MVGAAAAQGKVREAADRSVVRESRRSIERTRGPLRACSVIAPNPSEPLRFTLPSVLEVRAEAPGFGRR
jgi:hypothetical protein